jgi:hypothetical protein
MKTFSKSAKLENVCYDIRGPVLEEADRMIAAGEKIGLQGSTGNSTGPHLHFEIRKPSWENRNEVDPTAYLGINNQTGEVRAIPHDPYADDRDWAISKGITDGLEPDRQATRKEVWAMLRRLVS